MLRQWNLSWNEKFDLNLESDELFCVWVDHKPINPLNTPTPTLLLVSSTEDLKTVPNLRFGSKPLQIHLLFQSYIHLVAFPSEWASSIIGWNNHRSTTGLLFCSDNMGFVLLLNEQHGFCFVPMTTTLAVKTGKVRKINSIIILQLFLCFLVFFLSSCFIYFWDQTFDCQNQDFFWRQNLSILILGFFSVIKFFDANTEI